MVLQAGGVNLPGVRMALPENAETPTKILCLTEVVPAFEIIAQP